MKEFLDFLAKDFPEGNKLDGSVIVGYGVAQTMVQVLKQCGDDLTRENVMKQAANLKDFRTEVLLPGIMINTSPTDFAPISQLQLHDGSRASAGSCSATSSAATSAADRLRHPANTTSGTPAAPPAGVFFCGNRMDNRDIVSPSRSP